MSKSCQKFQGPVAVAALCLVCTPVHAQDFRQTVVVTAAARPVELGSVTRTMTVITRQQIEALPVHSIADVLRLASSIDVRARGERGVQTDFALRGATFGQMLMLVDGVRLNDAQSGHHNGDIPVPLDAGRAHRDPLRPRVVAVWRRCGRRHGQHRHPAATRASRAAFEGGSFGLAAGRGQAGLARGDAARVAGGVSFDRSTASCTTATTRPPSLRSRTSLGGGPGLSVSYLWKEFGANNFYGGNAPSREWTNQTLIAVDHSFGERQVAGASMARRRIARTAIDFVFNQLNPALSDNRHRTHAVLVSASGSRPVADRGSLTLGLEGGGDWIRSTNLGDHDDGSHQRIRRMAAAGRCRTAARDAASRRSLRRVRDVVEPFARRRLVGRRPRCASAHRSRRAFRVPTFTERYYSDPGEPGARRGRPGNSRGPRKRGVDIVMGGGWLLQTSVFARAGRRCDRLAARDDGRRDGRRTTCATSSTLGFEVGVQKTLCVGCIRARAIHRDRPRCGDGRPAVEVRARLRAALRSPQPAAIPLPAGFRVAPRLEYRRRSRSTGTVRLRAARHAPRTTDQQDLRSVRRWHEPVRRELSGDRRRHDARRGVQRFDRGAR